MVHFEIALLSLTLGLFRINLYDARSEIIQINKLLTCDLFCFYCHFPDGISHNQIFLMKFNPNDFLREIISLSLIGIFSQRHTERRNKFLSSELCRKNKKFPFYSSRKSHLAQLKPLKRKTRRK